jgi:hypothetical protein
MLDRIIHTCEEGKVSLNQHRSGVGDSVGYLGAEKVIGMLLHFKIKEFISFSLGIASPCLRCLRWLRDVCVAFDRRPIFFERRKFLPIMFRSKFVTKRRE